jgi:hypothetical protein
MWSAGRNTKAIQALQGDPGACELDLGAAFEHRDGLAAVVAVKRELGVRPEVRRECGQTAGADVDADQRPDRDVRQELLQRRSGAGSDYLLSCGVLGLEEHSSDGLTNK